MGTLTARPLLTAGDSRRREAQPPIEAGDSASGKGTRLPIALHLTSDRNFAYSEKR